MPKLKTRIHELRKERNMQQAELAYAEGIPEEIDEKEIKRRKDIRNIRMVTIDGEDAKDLDDAVSIEKLENGKYNPSLKLALDIAKVFGKTVEEVFIFEDDTEE